MTFDISDACLGFFNLLLHSLIFHIIVIVDAIIIFLFWFWHWYCNRSWEHWWANECGCGGYDDRTTLFGIIVFLDFVLFVILYTYFNGIWRL